jgi:hypothetical protein
MRIVIPVHAWAHDWATHPKEADRREILAALLKHAGANAASVMIESGCDLTASHEVIFVYQCSEAMP